MSRCLCCLVAMVLAAAPATTRGEGAGRADQAARLAATLTGVGETMALIEAGESQVWLRPGDRIDSCVLGPVDSSSAELECRDRRLHLRLDGGETEGPQLASAPPHVVLPPGWIEALAARPQVIALGLDLVPEADGAGVRGWRVTRLDPESPLSLLGIREQDLVLAVAGFPAYEARALAAGLRGLPELGSFNVTLQRAGQVIDLAVVAPRSDIFP